MSKYIVQIVIKLLMISMVYVNHAKKMHINVNIAEISIMKSILFIFQNLTKNSL